MTSPTERSPAERPVVLVTGASRGIGRATALAAAGAGWDVAVGYRTDAAAAGEVVAACTALGAQAVATPGDVSEQAGVDQAFAVVEAEFGRLDALVANAGIVSPLGRVEDMDAARIEQVLRINVTGVLLCAGAAVRRMSRRHGGPGGVIVTVSSRAAVLGGAGDYVDYAASKAAVDAITVGLAAEVVDEGIRVVGVRPGVIETEIHAPGRLERVGPQLPMRRPGTAEEVAAAILWLMSPNASYVTGTLLDVGGGR
jgi:NAD(P)-dependent dehydrogenase (short-subunit alcohol dehydrogenase family)